MLSEEDGLCGRWVGRSVGDGLVKRVDGAVRSTPPSCPVFCLLVLSVIGRGVLKSLSVIVELCIYFSVQFYHFLLYVF